MVSDGRGRPLNFFLSPGQMSDAKGALVLLAELPPAKRLIGDKGYDADWLRDELKARSVRVCIPARSGRSRPARLQTCNGSGPQPKALQKSAPGSRSPLPA